MTKDGKVRVAIIGGDTDPLAMLDGERTTSRKIFRRRAVASRLDYAVGEDSVHIGPSDSVPRQRDGEFALPRFGARGWGDVLLRVGIHAPPTSAGTVIEALEGAGSRLTKSPTWPGLDARRLTGEFITAHPRRVAERPVEA